MHRATAQVECWSGTVNELCSVVESLSDILAAIDDDGALASVSWVDGTNSRVSQLDELRGLLTPERFGDILAVRISARTHTAVKVTLVARPKIPGLVLEIEGPDPATVLGAAEIAFQRMMVGYIDRMGGLRGLVWMLFALAPTILVSWAVAESSTSNIVRAGLFLVAGLSGVSIFVLSGPRLLVSQSFALLESVPKNRVEKWRMVAKSLYARKQTKAALGVAGALLLGVIGNKLSDLIPFP